VTFNGIQIPPPNRFRDGDFWRDPASHLCSVRPAPGLVGACLLRPINGSRETLLRRTQIRGWTRVTWGGGR
jgi:hypothetical protein